MTESTSKPKQPKKKKLTNKEDEGAEIIDFSVRTGKPFSPTSEALINRLFMDRGRIKNMLITFTAVNNEGDPVTLTWWNNMPIQDLALLSLETQKEITGRI